MKKSILALLLVSGIANAAPSASTVATLTYLPTGHVKQAVTMQSLNKYTLMNDTDTPKHFLVHLSLCPLDKMDRCIYSNRDYTVTEHNSIHEEFTLSTVAVFNAPGEHAVVTTTEVSGAATDKASEQKSINIIY